MADVEDALSAVYEVAYHCFGLHDLPGLKTRFGSFADHEVCFGVLFFF